MRWSRRASVLDLVLGCEFAFATEEGGHESTVWRYRFEPAAGGTRVTESYEVKRIPVWARILDVPTNRHRELLEGMRHTLPATQDRSRVIESHERPAVTLKVAPGGYLLDAGSGEAPGSPEASSPTKRPVPRRQETWRWPR